MFSGGEIELFAHINIPVTTNNLNFKFQHVVGFLGDLIITLFYCIGMSLNGIKNQR
jgi:hypothetical protein